MESLMGEVLGNLSSDEINSLLNFTPPLDPLRPIENVLRTPEDCFQNLKDYPFHPNYVNTRYHGSIRIHYVDEGPKHATETILLMHGEPSWSYLYRHMIPILVRAGFRVIAPDLVGFGKSDKPALQADYSYERHVNWMSDFVIQAELSNITLFAQDWGGLIGLRVAARLPERFIRIAIGNTGLPIGGVDEIPQIFRMWAGIVSQKLPNWAPLFKGSVVSKELSKEEERAYNAPFPEEKYMAGSRIFPRLVPLTDGHSSVEENKGAIKRIFQNWNIPFITLFSDKDPITNGGEKFFQDLVPGAKGQKHEIIEDAGHFLQVSYKVQTLDYNKLFIFRMTNRRNCATALFSLSSPILLRARNFRS
mmetsp:Transcript_6281/g.7219  ORF Transcript_6281/g.7219 Transcript_6281/m.7219 type:complete len:362 (+) Transcript_6281:61-1146(+)